MNTDGLELSVCAAKDHMNTYGLGLSVCAPKDDLNTYGLGLSACALFHKSDMNTVTVWRCVCLSVC